MCGGTEARLRQRKKKKNTAGEDLDLGFND